MSPRRHHPNCGGSGDVGYGGCTCELESPRVSRRLGAPRRAPRRIKRPGWYSLGPVMVETGELRLSDGAGAAMSIGTWLGDGIYPVYARYAESEYFPGELRIAEVRVIFDGSEAPR